MEKLAPVKKFWNDHKAKILGGTTVVLAAVVALQARGIREFNHYLDENGLTDDYYFNNETEEV